MISDILIKLMSLRVSLVIKVFRVPEWDAQHFDQYIESWMIRGLQNAVAYKWLLTQTPIARKDPQTLDSKSVSPCAHTSENFCFTAQFLFLCI